MELCALVENLLAPKAEQRPAAKQVYQRACRMSELLNPALDALNINMLNITVAGKRAEPRTIKKITDNTWEAELAPLPKAGDYNVKAYAWVNKRKTESGEGRTVRLGRAVVGARRLYRGTD